MWGEVRRRCLQINNNLSTFRETRRQNPEIMLQKTPDLDSVVVKHNRILPSLGKLELSELRLLAFCLAHIDDNTPEKHHITARVDDLKRIFQMETDTAYETVKKTFLNISQKPLEFEDEKETKHLRHWFSGFSYQKGSGEFGFTMTQEVLPYLLALKGSFTLYRLADVYQFSSALTWKLYENLARWRKAGKWEVSLDELRLLLGVAGKYPLWSDFKKWVIDPAFKQINAKSDLMVEYTPIKRGRRIVGVVFAIKTLDKANEIHAPESPVTTLCDLLKSAGLSAKTARSYAERIDSNGLTETITDKLPGIIERAATAKTTTVAYIVGSLNKELNQLDLFDAEKNEPPHKAALDCWTEKKQAGEVCAVRKRGKAGQRKKCQICLEKLPVSEWGV